MDWVKDFYAKQQQWSGVYTSAVSDYNRKRALQLQSMAGVGRKSVLELGAGGGQNAFATAELGYDVTAIELLEESAVHATGLVRHLRNGSLHVLQADFYEIRLGATYDVISYWDGFGIGQDSDQVRLLRRIAQWLNRDGVVIMDIYSPWYWARFAGQEMSFHGVTRRYEFDAFGSRMIDRWWPDAAPEKGAAQSLRCYSPADLKLLLGDTGLVLVDSEIVPGGMVDYEKGAYIEETSLDQCMQYTVKLVRAY